MFSRPDNVSVAAESPAPSPHACAEISTTSDAEWVREKYQNFRAFVRSLVPTISAVRDWSVWLDKLPLAVFLAGGDDELAAVRAAADQRARDSEAGLVVERWATLYGFEPDALDPEQLSKLRRYVALFASV